MTLSIGTYICIQVHVYDTLLSATSVTECALSLQDNACTNMVQPLFPLFVEGCSVLLVRLRFYALV